MSFTNLNAVAKASLFFHRSYAAFWDTVSSAEATKTHAMYMLLVGEGNVQHNLGL